MNTEQFCFWLKGFADLHNEINQTQWGAIKSKLEQTLKGEEIKIELPLPKPKEKSTFKSKLGEIYEN